MRFLEVLAYITIVVVIGFFCWVECANAADHAIVSFNDAEHLAVLQDSVVGVCDTVQWEKPPGPGMDYQWRRITCRRLVGVTARWPETEMQWVQPEGDYPKIYLRGQEINIPMEWREIFTPGKAIIFYKEEQ